MIDSKRALAAADIAAVRRLNDVAATFDGFAALGETALLGLQADLVHLLTHDEAERHLIGYAQIDPASGATALVVAPKYRRRGIGSALSSAASTSGASRAWAHGTLPGAVALATHVSWAPNRVLIAMELLDMADLAPVTLPDGVAIRAFEVGRDEPAWAAINARAFSHLPDQGSWTAADVEAREALPWFDPAGFLLATDARGALVGFHWTKRTGAADGEVYVVGVDPAWQGRGLGKALTLLGLLHLRAAGSTRVTLYADATNAPALALYGRLGFVVTHRDTEYAPPVS